jgi:hypothetical protein
MAEGRTKRRTREHVIADQSVNFVERFVIDAGYTTIRVIQDYGCDLMVMTYDDDGYVEPGYLYCQLKATSSLQRYDGGDHYWFPLDERDFNLWLEEPMPVIFFLYDAVRRRAYWVDVQAHFRDNPPRARRSRARTLRIRVPKTNRVTARTTRVLRGKKADVVRQDRSLGGRHA